MTYGVGGLKVVNATAQAFAEKSPVVVGIVPWRDERIPELLGSGRGHRVRTEGELERALASARDDRPGSSLLRVHLDPHGLSPALQRLSTLIARRVR